MLIARLQHHEPEQLTSPLAVSKVREGDFPRFAPGFEADLICLLGQIEATFQIRDLEYVPWQIVAGVVIFEPPSGFAQAPYGAPIQYPQNALAFEGTALSFWCCRGKFESDAWLPSSCLRLCVVELARLHHAYAYGKCVNPCMMLHLVAHSMGRSVKRNVEGIRSVLT